MVLPYRVAPNGQRVDYVWNDKATENEPPALEIQRNMFVQRPKFELFGIGNIVINLVGIALLPLVSLLAIYLGWMGIRGAFVVLFIVALCAVAELFTEFKLQVLRYSFGVQNNQAARDAYENGYKEQAHDYLQAAITATTPKPPPAQSMRLSLAVFMQKRKYL